MQMHVGLFCFIHFKMCGRSRGGGRVKIFHVKLGIAAFAEKKMK